MRGLHLTLFVDAKFVCRADLVTAQLLLALTRVSCVESSALAVLKIRVTLAAIVTKVGLKVVGTTLDRLCKKMGTKP